MARPLSVHSSWGKRATSTSVKPLLAARLMTAAACDRRSLSDTPDGFENFSINAFFSASAAERLRAAAEAFSASLSAICSRTSFAVGKVSSVSAVFNSVLVEPPFDILGRVSEGLNQSADAPPEFNRHHRRACTERLWAVESGQRRASIRSRCARSIVRVIYSTPD